MPLRSKAQWAYMWANHPDIAHRWQQKAPVSYKNLPRRKRKSVRDYLKR